MKKILYVLIGLVAVWLILCLIGPSHIKVERSIDINANADMVRTKIIDLKFFNESWSPFTEHDPAMTFTYTGEAGKEDSVSWTSKEMGNGSMTYKYTHGDTIMESLYFEGHGESQVYHIVTANGEGSKVTWIMENDVPFVGRFMMLFMNMDKMIGPDFEKGLAKLKVAIESMPAETATNYEVKELNWDAKTFYGKRNKLSLEKIAEFSGQTYGKVIEAMGKTKTEPIGMPKAIYFSFDEKTMVADFAPVMEVANGTKLEGVEKFETPAGKVLLIEYFGAYDKSANAHYAMDTYMKEKGLTQNFVIEEYANDPMVEKDTAKWQTNIFYLVK